MEEQFALQEKVFGQIKRTKPPSVAPGRMWLKTTFDCRTMDPERWASLPTPHDTRDWPCSVPQASTSSRPRASDRALPLRKLFVFMTNRTCTDIRRDASDRQKYDFFGEPAFRRTGKTESPAVAQHGAARGMRSGVRYMEPAGYFNRL